MTLNQLLTGRNYAANARAAEFGPEVEIMKRSMKWIALTVVTALALSGGSFLAQQNKTQPIKDDVALRAAIEKETVQGDLKGAIELYKKVALSKDRAIAARALVQMAQCYQKLGDDESRKIYERIAREYGDQKDAVAIARAHLGSSAPTIAKGDRSVWSGPNVDGFGTISPDGRFLTYVDWAKTGALKLRDLTTGTDRPLNPESWLTGAKGGAQYSAISRDGKWVAYEWYDADKPDELRIVSLQGTGMPESRLLLRKDEIPNIAPMSWSPDGKWIAARVGRKDRTIQVALISAQDGEVRILKSSGWSDRGGKIFFSPDSRYIAYGMSTGDKTSDIFIMAVDGTRETDAVAHASSNAPMGWSPDGKHLLFASDRTGSWGLWIVPITDGKAQASPSLVKADIGSSWSLGVSASGTLFTWKRNGAQFVQISEIDLNARKLVGPRTGVSQQYIDSRGRPAWSPDGKQLAYSSCGMLGGGPCSLLVESLDTGRVRETPARLGYFSFLSWSPDGREVVLTGQGPDQNAGIYRVNIQTGETSLVRSNNGSPAGVGPQWAHDGKSIYYRLRPSAGASSSLVIFQHDLATGSEHELVRAPAAGNGLFTFSPDARLIAVISNEGSKSSLLILPASGGTARSVFSATAPEVISSPGPPMWTPDGDAVIVVKSNLGSARSDLWEVPIDGGQPRKLDIDLNDNSVEQAMSLSPDGKHLAFLGSAGKAGYEIWALENFLPR